MMNRLAWALLGLAACGPTDRGYPPPSGPSYLACGDWQQCEQPDEDHACTRVAWSCEEHACVEEPLDEGTTCFGRRSDLVHGRCDDVGECVVQDWTCVGDPDVVDGASCWQPYTGCWGRCADQACCTGCLTKAGHCHDTVPPAYGYACPE